MKKTIAIFSFLLYFLPTYAQNDVLIGIDGSYKYSARQQALAGFSYQGTGTYDIGFSIMRRIRRSGIFWQTGLNFNKYSERLIENIDSKTRRKTAFKRYAASVPVGVKFFFSDRRCVMFVHPSLSFDYYFEEEKIVQGNFSFFNQEITEATHSKIGDNDSFVATARLAIGGLQPVSEKVDILLQLEGTYGVFGTGTFAGNEPWSIGIRSGIFYRL